MSQSREYTIEELARRVGGRLVAPDQVRGIRIHGVDTLLEATTDCISWLSDARHAKHLADSRAAAVIGTEELVGADPRGLVVSDPESAIADVLDLFDVAPDAPAVGVHPTALIDATAHVAPDAAIGPYCVIGAGSQVGARCVLHEGVSLGRDVRVGDDCVLYAHSVLYDRTRVGHRVILHAGVVLGADGFGYLFRDGRHRKLAHLGHVMIEDDVEIGPNTVVDRAKVGVTLVGKGSKIDALVMVGHNVRIGPLCVIAGQAGLSGSVRLGAGVAVGGQAGFSHGVTVGDGVQVAAQSGVISGVEAGRTVLGSPADDASEQWRIFSRIRKLQKLYDEVAELRRRVNALEAATDD